MKSASAAAPWRRASPALRPRLRMSTNWSFRTNSPASRPRAVATERSVFDTHSRKLAQDIDVLVPAGDAASNETLQLLNREIELTRKLYEQKVVPEIEMLRLERQATEMRGQLAEVQSRKITRQDDRSRPRPTTISPNRAAISRCSTKTSSRRRTACAAPNSCAGLRHRQQAQRQHDRRRGAARAPA